MKLIAHRGACLEEQEDTLASLEKGAAYGAFAVECDPRYTADGVLVIYHDDDLERLTGKKLRVDEITFAEMRSVLAEKGLALTTFDEVVRNYSGNAAVLFDLYHGATDGELYKTMAATRFRSIAGVHAPEEARVALKYMKKENVLAFMPRPEDIEAFRDAGVGIIRLWEHWLRETPLSAARAKLPADTEIWIMSRDKSVHHPLFCMNGSADSLRRLQKEGADGVLLNDIALIDRL